MVQLFTKLTSLASSTSGVEELFTSHPLPCGSSTSHDLKGEIFNYEKEGKGIYWVYVLRKTPNYGGFAVYMLSLSLTP